MSTSAYETNVVDPNLFGWLDLPVQVQAVAQTFPLGPTLSQAAPRLFDTPSKRDDVLSYKALKEVQGSYPRYPAQTVGDCTSQGGAHTVDLTACLEILLGDAEEFKEISTEVLYGIAREIAGMLGSGDGCFGTAIGKALAQGACVPREVTGPYSGAKAREYGRNGVPDDLKKIGRQHPLLYSALVTTLAEADAALDNGFMMCGGGMEAFSSTRDQYGVCARTWGVWPHMMGTGWGRRRINGVVHYLYAQSWGPETPSGPTPDDIPPFTYWVHEADHAKRLARGDTIVIGNFQGFPKRSLPSAWTNSHWLA
jgi:hypothetical protein